MPIIRSRWTRWCRRCGGESALGCAGESARYPLDSAQTAACCRTRRSRCTCPGRHRITVADGPVMCSGSGHARKRACGNWRRVASPWPPKRCRAHWNSGVARCCRICAGSDSPPPTPPPTPLRSTMNGSVSSRRGPRPISRADAVAAELALLGGASFARTIVGEADHRAVSERAAIRRTRRGPAATDHTGRRTRHRPRPGDRL